MEVPRPGPDIGELLNAASGDDMRRRQPNSCRNGRVARALFYWVMLREDDLIHPLLMIQQELLLIAEHLPVDDPQRIGLLDAHQTILRVLDDAATRMADVMLEAERIVASVRGG